MRAESICKLLRALGAVELKPTRRSIKASCLFAPWTHENGSDKHPSMSVMIADNGVSGFKCFTCGRFGTLHAMIEMYEVFTHQEYSELHELVREERDPAKHLMREIEKAKEPQRLSMPELETFSDSILQRYDVPMHPYFEQRGFTAEDWEMWGLRHDPVMRRIIFPVRDEKGRITGLIGRSTEGEEPPYLMYGRWQSGIPFGVHRINPSRPAVIVEGPLDAIRVSSTGIADGLALCGTSTAKACLPRLNSLWRSRLILMLDGDKAGRATADYLESELRSGGNLYRVNLMDGDDPGKLSVEECRAALEIAEWVPSGKRRRVRDERQMVRPRV